MKFSLFRKHGKESEPSDLQAAQSRNVTKSNSPVGSIRSNASSPPPVSSSSLASLSPTLTQPRVGRHRSDSARLAASGTGSRPSNEHPPNLEKHREGKLKLRVVMDPISTELDPSQTNIAGGSKLVLKDTFFIYLDSNARVEDVREAIHDELGSRGMYSLGCFKVQIPLLAHSQGTTHTETYGIPVHLLAHFPAYDIFDASQLVAYRSQEASAKRMTGSGGWNPQPFDDSQTLKVSDWWPKAVGDTDGTISVIVRLGPMEPNYDNPMTFLAHFSNGPGRRAYQPSSSQSPDPASAADTNARPPLVFEFARHSTVDELKSFLLQVEGKDSSRVDSVAIWRVDLSWEEMLRCEAFGGLKDGSMPWPYPPNAPTPIAVDSSRDHLKNFFPEPYTNTNLVSMFVWIDPEVEHVASANSGDDVPFFSYPMSFATAGASRKPTRSSSQSRPHSRSSENISTVNSEPSRTVKNGNGKGGWSRPVTAPAAFQTSPAKGFPAVQVKPPAFGSRATLPISRAPPRSNSRMNSGQRSPLSEECFKPNLGLAIGGIAMAGPVMQTKLSISSDFAPEDGLESTSPRTSMGRLSMTSSASQSSAIGLLTPPHHDCLALPDIASLKV